MWSGIVDILLYLERITDQKTQKTTKQKNNKLKRSWNVWCFNFFVFFGQWFSLNIIINICICYGHNLPDSQLNEVTVAAARATNKEIVWITTYLDKFSFVALSKILIYTHTHT